MIALIGDADRARPRLRRRGPRPVQRALDAGLRPPVRPQPRRADRRRARRRGPLQARPGRLRPVEAAAAGDQPGWDSPWGRGRPGWHIECSAMSEHFSGAAVRHPRRRPRPDLPAPRERDRPEPAAPTASTAMARYWLHNGFLDMRGEKMSKSLGNVVRVERRWPMAPGEATALLAALDPLPAAGRLHRGGAGRGPRRACGASIASWTTSASSPEEDAEPDEAIIDALADDLNTPAALAVLHCDGDHRRTASAGQLGRSGPSPSSSRARRAYSACCRTIPRLSSARPGARRS